jgi:hypothetical protein
MTSCPTDDDFVRFVDGALSLEQTESVRVHMARCQRCHEHDETLRALIGDVKAPFSVDIDARAHARAVMERLDRPQVTRPRRLRARWIGAGSAAACGLFFAAYLGWRTAPAGTWQARGAGIAATIGRDVGVQLYAAEEELRPLPSRATIGRATPLTAGFRNLGRAPAFLLLFAMDTRHTLHWISPRYTRPGDDPISTALPATIEEQLLDTTVVFEDITPGPLRVVAVITSMPAHVSDIERLEGMELRAGDLLERVPGAEVRETMLEVRDVDGGLR